MRWIPLCLALLAPAAHAAEWRSDGLCDTGTLPADLRLQLQRGAITCGDTADGPALRFEADAKAGTVGKAALIVPFEAMPAGRRVSVSAEVFLPPDSPANSIVLIDVECKRCGLPGNPGLRLYLRDAGLRVDRKKIGERHAWAVRDPERLTRGAWQRIGWTLTLASDTSGRSEVTLQGAPVLTNSGRTLPPAGADSAVDRVQIGITANSNAVPVTLMMRDIRITLD